MRRVARKGVATVMATGGMLAAAAGYAHADSGAEGAAAGSPGVLSGNSVQVPVNVPVNVCGNTVNVVGLLNPAVGNRCSNDSHHDTKGSQPGGATARGKAEGSPGVLSGNHVQAPVDVPVNVSGNSVNVIGIGNSAVGNSSSNHSRKDRNHPEQPRGSKPPTAHQPAAPRTPAARHEARARTAPAQNTATLAQTGADVTGFVLPAGAGLLLGGIVLYRRFRPAKP